MNKLLKTNQDKIQKFAKLLRKKLMTDGCHKNYVSSLSEQQILKDFRTCADCEKELYSKDQQMHAILEFDSAERTFEILYGDHVLDELHFDDEEPVYLSDILDDEDDEDDEDEEIEVIRGCWALDGCESLESAIESTKCFLEHLEHLRDEGYEFLEPVEDDCGYLKKNDET
jgi:hypothetical protein